MRDERLPETRPFKGTDVTERYTAINLMFLYHATLSVKCGLKVDFFTIGRFKHLFLMSGISWSCEVARSKLYEHCNKTLFSSLRASNCFAVTGRRNRYHSNINISQGSVATCLRCGGMFNDCCIANFLEIVKVKEWWKSANIWQSMCRAVGVHFFWPTLYIYTRWCTKV